MNFFYLRDAC